MDGNDIKYRYIKTANGISPENIAAIPYTNRSDIEESYQNIIFSVFRLIGAEIHNEVHMNKGRVDAPIVNCDHIYIIENKMDQSADDAIAQIKLKGYAQPLPRFR